MKKKNGIFIHLSILMVLVLVFTSSCEKSPEPSYGSVTDQDGNTYKTVEIGDQTWMAENLKTTKYNDNGSIPNVTGNSAWSRLTTPGYCWYDNDEVINKPLYGAIYNWYAVKTGKLCPAGWHVPADSEYVALEISLGMTQEQAMGNSWCGSDQGSKMKNNTGWKPGENGNNASGFSALPGGYRYRLDGAFNNMGDLSYWWCSDESGPTTAYYRRLDGNNPGVFREGALKAAGKYVRCVMD